MTMTNDLSAAVAKVKELDAKRTQGQWDRITGYYRVEVRNGDDIDTVASCQNASNAAFIAHAPQMASIITEQDTIIEQQRAALRQAREAMVMQRDNNFHKFCQAENINARQLAIAAIDAALGTDNEGA